jgi:alkylation response protein AidB-like acyl-CoA dehydrogenase
MVLDSANRLHAGEVASGHCSATKVYVAERSLLLLQECVQLTGGMGVTWEHELHRYLRRATTNAATFGTVAEHRARVGRLSESLRD